MPKIQQTDIGEKVRQMGYEDYFCDYPQSWASHFFGPTSLAYQHWIEGWEQAQVEMYSAMQEEKAKWIVEQEKRNEYCYTNSDSAPITCRWCKEADRSPLA